MARVADRRRHGFNEGHETAWIAIALWSGLPARIANAAGRNNALVFALPAEWTIHLSRRLPRLEDAAVTARPGIATDLNAMGAPAPIAHWRAILLRWTGLNASFATADR
ncbi:MAG: hypothetical protein L0H10_09455 [Comamonas sp.]|uniref:hypothetical protein n=1 Tax=Comamonas TaxID=283 RepID=UPI0012D70FEE|nr:MULTISPECIES: hypothetical protein [Comamonas]MDN5504031.1 hypothetical protein [Comamonas sp.]MDN5536750.1 hypothetical protein [Comamonas sp.]